MNKLLIFILMFMLTVIISCNNDDEPVPSVPNTSGMNSAELALVGVWIRDKIEKYNSAGGLYEIAYMNGTVEHYVGGILSGTDVYNPVPWSINFTNEPATLNTGYYNDTIIELTTKLPGVWKVDLNYQGSSYNHVLIYYIRSCTSTSLVLSNTSDPAYISDWKQFYHKQ